MIRLLALDMDGTCLNGRSRMTEETIQISLRNLKGGYIMTKTFIINKGQSHRLNKFEK